VVTGHPEISEIIEKIPTDELEEDLLETYKFGRL